MIEIVVYNTTDGDILKCVMCPAEIVSLQYGPGEAYIEHARVDDTKFKVDLATLSIVPVD